MNSSNSLIVVDNFYAEPLRVVERAQNARYDRSGRYSHFERSPSFFPRNIIEVFESLLGKRVLLDELWSAPRISAKLNGSNFNGTFYRVPHGSLPPTHVHHDSRNWIGVVYLGLSAQFKDGTAFYRHRETGLTRTPMPGAPYGDDQTHRDGADRSKWELIHFVGNQFNRLLLYEGVHYHSACISNTQGRLCQLFTFHVCE